MAKYWVKKAFAGAHGQLHEDLGIAKDKKIPAGKLESATHSRNPKTRKRASLAKTARGFKKR